MQVIADVELDPCQLTEARSRARSCPRIEHGAQQVEDVRPPPVASSARRAGSSVPRPGRRSCSAARSLHRRPHIRYAQELIRVGREPAHDGLRNDQHRHVVAATKTQRIRLGRSSRRRSRPAGHARRDRAGSRATHPCAETSQVRAGRRSGRCPAEGVEPREQTSRHARAAPGRGRWIPGSHRMWPARCGRYRASSGRRRRRRCRESNRTVLGAASWPASRTGTCGLLRRAEYGLPRRAHLQQRTMSGTRHFLARERREPAAPPRSC